MKDHIFELRRKMWIYRWSTQLYTQHEQFKSCVQLRWSIINSYLSPQLKYMIFHILIYILRLSRVYNELIWPAPRWLDSSVGRALHRYRRGYGGVEYRSGLNFFSGFNFTTAQVVSIITAMINHKYQFLSLPWFARYKQITERAHSIAIFSFSLFSQCIRRRWKGNHRRIFHITLNLFGHFSPSSLRNLQRKKWFMASLLG